MRELALRLTSVIFCIGMFVFETRLANAQAVANAQITGDVTDPTGAAVAGATVKMIEIERGVTHEAKSDSNGRYTLPNLPVGPYRLEAALSGFKTYTQTGITLQVGDHPESISPSKLVPSRRASKSQPEERAPAFRAFRPAAFHSAPAHRTSARSPAPAIRGFCNWR